MSPTPILMGTTGADETSFNFTGFGAEGTFTLGIKACNNNGCSAISTIVAHTDPL